MNDPHSLHAAHTLGINDLKFYFFSFLAPVFCQIRREPFQVGLSISRLSNSIIPSHALFVMGENVKSHLLDLMEEEMRFSVSVWLGVFNGLFLLKFSFFVVHSRQMRKFTRRPRTRPGFSLSQSLILYLRVL